MQDSSNNFNNWYNYDKLCGASITLIQHIFKEHL